MKRLSINSIKSIVCILSVVAIIVAVLLGSAVGQTTTTNYLKLKGKVLDGYTSNIQVFERLSENSWTKVDTKKNRSRYNLRLDPELDYRIYFTSNEGHMKVLHVEGGIRGMWISELDVNFDQKNIKYARLYQVPKKSTYTVAVVYKDMSGSKIVIGSNDREVAETKASR